MKCSLLTAQCRAGRVFTYRAMSNQEKGNPRLESILQRWGAQEAAAQTSLPPMRKAHPTLRMAMVWGGPMAAAAAAVVLLALWPSLFPHPPATDDSDLRAELVRLQEENHRGEQKLGESLHKATIELQDQKDKIAAALASLQKRCDDLKRQYDDVLARGAGDVLRKKIVDLQAELADEKERLANEQKQQASTLAALKAANDRAGRLAATQPSNQPLPHDVAQQVIELEAKLSNTESLVDAAKREIDRQKKLADEMRAEAAESPG